MSVLETAMRDLAAAIDALETRIDDRFHNDDIDEAERAAIERHAGAARREAARAGEELAGAIADLEKLAREAR